MRYRLTSTVTVLWRLVFTCRYPFFVFLRKIPSHRTCEVLSRSCRRILDTTRLEMFSRDHPIPRFPYLFKGYAMHYAIPCVSKKLLSRFSLAFCKYLRCFARQDDCTDTRYVYVLPIWFYILFLLIISHVYVKVASITNIIVKYKISCWNILLWY